jgi:hypothetical protein
MNNMELILPLWKTKAESKHSCLMMFVINICTPMSFVMCASPPPPSRWPKPLCWEVLITGCFMVAMAAALAT